MSKDSFILYKSFYEPIKTLSNEQLGRLFRMIFEYQANASNCYQTLAKDSLASNNENDDIKMAFLFIKSQLDLDNKKYNEVVEKRKQAGSNGGNARALKQKQAKLANASKTSKSKQKLANQAVYDYVNNNVINKENINLTVYTKETEEISLDFIDDKFLNPFIKFLEHKRLKKEYYANKNTLLVCYNSLVNDSGGDPLVAMDMVNKSITNGWSGFFPPKTSNVKPQAKKEVW